MTLPEDLYARAEHAARRLRVTRSALYTKALREYLDRHEQQQDVVTAQLDEVYAEPAAVGASGAQAGRRLIDSGTWAW